jgi:uncharacterized protein (TIGR03437 family)
VSGLAAQVTFGDAGTPAQHRTTIPLGSSFLSAAIPYLVNTASLPMSLYVSNTVQAKATAKVTVLTAGGATVGTAALSIPPGGRAVTALTALVAAAGGQTGGAIQISSDQPVAAAAMILPTTPSADFATIPAAPSVLQPAGGGPSPQIAAGGVGNAASFTPKLARGGLATIFGTNFSATTGQAQMLPLPLNLGNVFVTVGGVPAPMIFVNANQINFQVPFEAPSGASVPIVVTANGNASAAVSLPVADYGLGVFTYARTATALDPIIVHALTNQLVTPTNPATAGEALVVYATGAGKLNNTPRTGQATQASPFATTADLPVITVGGLPTTVLFSGLTPGLVGLVQLNIQLPANLPSGSQPLVVQFPGDSSVPVNLAVK